MDNDRQIKDYILLGGMVSYGTLFSFKVSFDGNRGKIFGSHLSF